MIHLETVHDGERQHLARLIARVRRQHHGFGRHLQQALRNRSLEFRATDFLDFLACLLTIPMTNIVPGSSNSYELVISYLGTRSWATAPRAPWSPSFHHTLIHDLVGLHRVVLLQLLLRLQRRGSVRNGPRLDDEQDNSDTRGSLDAMSPLELLRVGAKLSIIMPSADWHLPTSS